MDEQLPGRHRRRVIAARLARWTTTCRRVPTLLLLLGMLFSSFAGLATTYVYDSGGKLVAVSDDAGASARYTYDKIGNLTGVDRFSAGQLAIFTFAPARGAAGTVVKIRGQGFSATTSQNVVKFNGVSATVSASTATELTTSVPAGAATGTITVTVGSATAGSASSFVVDVGAGVPVINALSPTSVVAGQAVTVTGTRLMPVIGQTTTTLNGRTAAPSAISNAQIVFPVPLNASSGKVTVTTPYGVGTSAQDILVAPSGVLLSDIESVKRVSLNGVAQTLTANGAGKSVAVLYDAAVGDFPSLQFSGLGERTLSYTVYGVTNTQLASGAVEAGSPSVHLPSVKSAGTYLIVLRPDAPATWTLALEKAPALVSGGATLSQALTKVSQSKRFVFSATAGQNLGLALSELVAPNASYAYLRLYKPDGSYAADQYCYPDSDGCQVNVQDAVAGSYSLVVDAPAHGDRTMSFKVTLSTDISGTLALNTTKVLNLSRRGQNGRLTFSGTAGQTLGLQIAGQSTLPAGRTTYYTVYQPDGSVLNSTAITSGGTLNLPGLPATGTYTVFVDPYLGETSNAQLMISSGTTGGQVTNGASGSFSTTVPGQNVYLTFSASAGQNLGLALSELVVPNASYVQMRVYKPGGDYAADQYCYPDNGGCQVNLPNTVAGTYSVIVEAPSDGDRTMSFKSTLSTDITGALALNTTKALTLTRRGQNGRLTFSGAAGQTVALRISGQSTVPADRTVYYTVYQPDGAVLTSTSVTTDGTLNLPSLPFAGTYQVFADPYYGETASAQILLSSGVTGTTPVGGATGSHGTSVPGQNIYLSFNATAGQNLGLGLSDLVFPGGGTYLYATAYGPAGEYVASNTCYESSAGCQLNLSNLAAGTHSVVITPPSDGGQTMSFKSTLSVDAVVPLTANTAKTMSLTRRGQNGRLTFSATAGQSVALRVSGQSTAPADGYVHYTVYQPDGSMLTSMSVVTDGTLNLQSLPASGAYLVFADPNYGETAGAQVLLSTGVTGTVSVGGATGSYSTTVPGQNVYLSFTATAGQNLGLGLSDLVMPGEGSYLYATAYGPNGEYIAGNGCYASDGGCQLNLSGLTAGTHNVVIAAPSDGARTMSFKTTLSADVVVPLTANTAKALSVTRRGQNGRLTFSGTVGQTVALRIYGQSTVPANRNVYYTVYQPDGSMLTSTTVMTDGTLNLPSLPATGTYLVFADPYYGETASAQVLLSSGVTGTVSAGGATGSYTTTVPGQNVYLTFTATAGQNLGLGLSDLVMPGGGSYLYAAAYGPDGGQVASSGCHVSAGGCQLNLSSLAAGTYSLVIAPPYDGNQTMSFKTTLSADVVASLTNNTVKAISLTRRGQNGRLTFSGSAGQTVALRVSGQGTVPANGDVYYTIYQPDGSMLTSMSVVADGTLNLYSLPATGTYLVFVDPNYGETASAQVLLQNGVTGTMPVNGATGSHTTSVAGQNVYLSFTATAGQNLGLSFSDLAMPGGGSYLYATVYSPDGGHITSNACYVSQGGCQLNLSNLTAGTHSVVVTPPPDGNRTMSFKSTLSADVVTTLTVNSTKTLSLSRRGQNGWLTFSGTAGQALRFRVTAQTTTPSDRDVYYTVYQPDGVYLTSMASQSTASQDLPVLPQSGTYSIFVDPYYGETMSGQVLLSPAN